MIFLYCLGLIWSVLGVVWGVIAIFRCWTELHSNMQRIIAVPLTLAFTYTLIRLCMYFWGKL